MKNLTKIWIYPIIIIGVIFIFTLTTCNKKAEDPPPANTAPTVTTTSITNITETTATGGGNVTSEGSSSVTARGVCWSTSQNPTTSDAKTTDGSGTGSFTSNITGLTANTPYYVRAYATNSTGTGYGNQQSFTTQQGTGGTVTDVDGNVYNTVKIGMQVWMVENLRTTKYNDGSSIPLVTEATDWANLTTPAYCWYDNNSGYKNTYGALYNWYAVNSGKLAPTGWHLPSDAEWTALTDFLGGESFAGKMKEAGTAHWASPNSGATNSSGFTALPGGFRDYGGDFSYLTYDANFWSSTENFSSTAWTRSLSHGNEYVGHYTCSKTYGFSVRCIKD